MKISLIYTNYNGQQYFGSCLEPILKALPDEWECIIADDGSDEDSIEALKKYEKYRNTRVIYCRHGGVAAARNAGIAKATGQYIGFIDGDDTLEEGFVEEVQGLLEEQADLYIFGIRHVNVVTGDEELWQVDYHKYEDVHEFADRYIREHKLLIYSLGNKLYRRELLDNSAVRCDESMDFGEDRLFNYEFLKNCNSIISYDRIMLRYNNWQVPSLSRVRQNDFLSKSMFLHQKKMECFLPLSKNASAEEKEDFRRYDFYREVENTILHLIDYPDAEECIPGLNRIIFPEESAKAKPDVLFVLGSRDCGYRVQKAVEIWKSDRDIKEKLLFVVCGGNMHISGTCSESIFMRDALLEAGVDPGRIYVEDDSTDTFENLEKALQICRTNNLTANTIGIVTAGFHVERTKRMMKAIAGDSCSFTMFPAYGPHTGKDNWYKNEIGTGIILNEIRKLQQ